MNGTRLRRETPWPSRKGWQREPAADLLGQPDKLIAGGAVQEHRLQRLLPHLSMPGAHGKGSWPWEVFAEIIALFAGKHLGGDLATIGSRNVGHRDHMEAQSDLVEEHKLRLRETRHHEEICCVSIVVTKQREARGCRQDVDAMRGGTLPC